MIMKYLILVVFLVTIPFPTIAEEVSQNIEPGFQVWPIGWVRKTGDHTYIEINKEYQAAFKAPKAVVFLDELPKTGSGKIYKKGLRDAHLQKKK